jgi:uncharacterized membrane protein
MTDAAAAPTARDPQVRPVAVHDIVDSLAAGLRDFQAAPRYGIAVGMFFALGGWAVVLCVAWLGLPWLAYPLAAGFVILGPFAALALYEVSRRREAGVGLSPAALWSTIRARREVSWMAFVSLFIFIVWMYQVRLLIALFLGIGASFATLGEFLAAVLGTPQGLVFLAVGNGVGAVLSLLVFSLTVVSFPLLLDRDVDFVTAMITSVRSVATSPVAMIGWAACVTLILLASIAAGFLPLVVTLPVLGHATWHLYRKVVAPPG